MILRHPGFERLSRGVDGELSLPEQESLKSHLARCVNCEAVWQALSRVKTALRGLPAIEETLAPSGPSPFILAPPRPAILFKILFAILVALWGVSVLFLLPRQPALKVISGSPHMLSSEGMMERNIPTGGALRTLPPGSVDLELRNQLLIRMKPSTTITWQQVNRPLSVGRPTIVVNLMRGEMLARTHDKFWGSRLEVRTPAGTALVKGTAFSVKVDPVADQATVKVLAGSVFLATNFGPVGLDVNSGQTSFIQSDRLPHIPKNLSLEERQELLETFRIGEDPVLALVIGGGPERLEELLKPAILFAGMRAHPQFQFFLRKPLKEINRTILEGGDLSQQEGNLRVLEAALDSMTDPEVAIPMRLYVGSVAAHGGNASKALSHLRWVVKRAPFHPLASLALAAQGKVTERILSDPEQARALYEDLLRRYPRSPEAAHLRPLLGKPTR